MCPSRISRPSLIGCPIRRPRCAPNNGVTLMTLCLPVTLVPSWASCSVIRPLPCRWAPGPLPTPCDVGGCRAGDGPTVASAHEHERDRGAQKSHEQRDVAWHGHLLSRGMGGRLEAEG